MTMQEAIPQPAEAANKAPMPSELGAMALEYAERGWHVFPLKPDTKIPLISKKMGGNGHHDGTSDVEKVRRWWTATPNANIGLHLAASGLVAIDPDTYKPECEWHSFIQGREIPDTALQTSARGGKHYVFSATPGAHYAGVLCPGVEIKHEGYIVLAPSVWEGKPYAWDTDDDPAPCPDWVPLRGAKLSERASASAPLATGTDIARAIAALDKTGNELERKDWVELCLAVKGTCGDEAKGAFLAFSYRFADAIPGDPERLWETARPDGSLSLGSVFHLLGTGQGAPDDQSLPDWADGWFYNEALMEFHHGETGHSIKAGAFNAKFSRKQECHDAKCSASSLVLRHMTTVANTMFWPCSDTIIRQRGLDYVNIYRPHDVAPVAATGGPAQAAVQRIIDHAHALAVEPTEADMLLDFLAYVYQNPGKRVRWAILLFGIQGNGKTFWVDLMKRLMGHNAGEVAGTTVAQRFTGWAVNKLFIAIEEIRVPSESKYAVLDKLKPFITNNEVNVETKGQNDRVVPNFASYLLLTNHDDALPLDEGDRRYCVIETRHRTKEDVPGQDYFDALFGVLDDHIEAVAHYFATRQIDAAFNPNGRAPETSGKWRMMQESKSAPRLAVEEAIGEFRCDVINDDIVYVGALREQAAVWSTGQALPDPRSIGMQLKDMGYIKLTVGTRHQGPKVDGSERTIYYRPDLFLPSDVMLIVTKYITDRSFGR